MYRYLPSFCTGRLVQPDLMCLKQRRKAKRAKHGKATLAAAWLKAFGPRLPKNAIAVRLCGNVSTAKAAHVQQQLTNL